ncbi:MAG: DUF4373 domain-containing protein [Bacteroides sp.]|nr:DUF4373 domain-containing protein [Bacteroides sp.]MCM1403807.1 DUF4373 domain-containing protein [Bacteroides sp.]MCM1443541.1 DUF4373 domain-containing protein [Muribaculum sp.]MCM1577124.1 DUF4373 domain-containing protein [Bacteroides sp.]
MNQNVMSKNGISYYKIDTDRYDDLRIRKLKKDCGAQGLAIYDYILCQIYGVKGYYVVDDEEFLFNTADYLNVKRQNVSEVIGYACAVGLFDKELRTRESILTSVAIQKRWLTIAKHSKRSLPAIEEKYWLLPIENVAQQNENVVQQNENVVQQSKNVAQQNENVVQQSKNVAQQNENVVQHLGENQTEKEQEKENFPRTPLKEKEKEKEILKGGEQEILSAANIEKYQNDVAILTTAGKRERDIEKRKQREQKFYNSLVPYLDKYGKDMIRNFFDYWSEPTRSGDKMRFEKQETWDLSRRLAIWSKRSNDFENGKFSNTKTESRSQTTATNRNSRDNYAEISDFVGTTII